VTLWWVWLSSALALILMVVPVGSLVLVIFAALSLGVYLMMRRVRFPEKTKQL
jgi:hypothetical protein